MSRREEMWQAPPKQTGYEITGLKTWAGPISTELYGKDLKDLCNRTNENLNRLSLEMRKMDPCLEFGMKHWHPGKRPVSGTIINTSAGSQHSEFVSVLMQRYDVSPILMLNCINVVPIGCLCIYQCPPPPPHTHTPQSTERGIRHF